MVSYDMGVDNPVILMVADPLVIPVVRIGMSRFIIHIRTVYLNPDAFHVDVGGRGHGSIGRVVDLQEAVNHIVVRIHDLVSGAAPFRGGLLGIDDLVLRYFLKGEEWLAAGGLLRPVGEHIFGVREGGIFGHFFLPKGLAVLHKLHIIELPGCALCAGLRVEGHNVFTLIPCFNFVGTDTVTHIPQVTGWNDYCMLPLGIAVGNFELSNIIGMTIRVEPGDFIITLIIGNGVGSAPNGVKCTGSTQRSI